MKVKQSFKAASPEDIVMMKDLLLYTQLCDFLFKFIKKVFLHVLWKTFKQKKKKRRCFAFQVLLRVLCVFMMFKQRKSKRDSLSLQYFNAVS